jgi:hypothetical protein
MMHLVLSLQSYQALAIKNFREVKDKSVVPGVRSGCSPVELANVSRYVS